MKSIKFYICTDSLKSYHSLMKWRGLNKETYKFLPSVETIIGNRFKIFYVGNFEKHPDFKSIFKLDRIRNGKIEP
jgi:hypothetical protein